MTKVRLLKPRHYKGDDGVSHFVPAGMTGDITSYELTPSERPLTGVAWHWSWEGRWVGENKDVWRCKAVDDFEDWVPMDEVEWDPY
jgi:hypothetical protein